MGYCNSYWGHYKSAVNLKLSGAERRVISLDGRTVGRLVWVLMSCFDLSHILYYSFGLGATILLSLHYTCVVVLFRPSIHPSIRLSVRSLSSVLI